MTITVVFFIKFVTLSFSKESHCNMQGRLYRNTGPGRKSVLGPLLPFFRESSGGGGSSDYRRKHLMQNGLSVRPFF